MRSVRPIPLCSFTWRSAAFPSHPQQLECLMMIPSKIASRSHVGSGGRDVSLVRCLRRCRATLICGASDRGTDGSQRFLYDG